MASLLNAVNDLAKGARFAAGVAAWSGHSLVRHVSAGLQGVCLICNNLQPYGHEDTFGRVGARWHDQSDTDGLHTLRAEGSAVATLVLPHVSPKRLLESREIDKETNLPK